MRGSFFRTTPPMKNARFGLKSQSSRQFHLWCSRRLRVSGLKESRKERNSRLVTCLNLRIIRALDIFESNLKRFVKVRSSSALSIILLSIMMHLTFISQYKSYMWPETWSRSRKILRVAEQQFDWLVNISSYYEFIETQNVSLRTGEHNVFILPRDHLRFLWIVGDGGVPRNLLWLPEGKPWL